MSNINASIDIDADEIITAVVESSHFDDAVNNCIGNFDFSYEMSNIVDDRINDMEYVEPYEMKRLVLEAIAESENIQHEIRMVCGETQSQAVTAYENEPQILNIIVSLHKICGNLAQQMAVINAMTGVHAWPHEVTTHLQMVAGTLRDLGIDLSKSTNIQEA